MNTAAEIREGDAVGLLPDVDAESVDAVVTDPPYEIGFMGKAWDKSGVAFDPRTWAAVLRVLKPGGYLLAMGGTRTYHRLTCAIEDAGFEIRDCLMWLYGTGFPKGKTCLKPAWEPIVLARRPSRKVLPLGIDACRVPTDEVIESSRNVALGSSGSAVNGTADKPGVYVQHDGGRYPANVLHDGSHEVMEAFAAFGEKTSGTKLPGSGERRDGQPDWRFAEGTTCYADTGTAARFFYCAKASRAERDEGLDGPLKPLLWSAGTKNPGSFQSSGTVRAARNNHPTVKPLALMRWQVKLVSQPGDLVLDPFAGSGTTGKAAVLEGRRFLGFELDAKHAEIARRRIAHAEAEVPPSQVVAELGESRGPALF